MANTANSNDTSNDWAIPVGLGASLLVLGGVAMAYRRRRRPYEEDVDFVPPVVMPPSRFTAQDSAIAQRPTEPERRVVVAPAQSHPADERGQDALLDQMVAAAPDAANPFTSRKARRRRARLILRSTAASADTPAERLSAHEQPAVPIRARSVRAFEDA